MSSARLAMAFEVTEGGTAWSVPEPEDEGHAAFIRAVTPHIPKEGVTCFAAPPYPDGVDRATVEAQVARARTRLRRLVAAQYGLLLVALAASGLAMSIPPDGPLARLQYLVPVAWVAWAALFFATSAARRALSGDTRLAVHDLLRDETATFLPEGLVTLRVTQGEVHRTLSPVAEMDGVRTIVEGDGSLTVRIRYGRPGQGESYRQVEGMSHVPAVVDVVEGWKAVVAARPRDPGEMTEGEAHEAGLVDLGFPPAVAREAGRALDLGLHDVRPPFDLTARTMDRLRPDGAFDRAAPRRGP